ncbi:MAG: DUF6430 domain-containing protein [Rhodobacter sp.]|nr:DUF6430 domain-containing protein [Rhodobacter sp.]
MAALATNGSYTKKAVSLVCKPSLSRLCAVIPLIFMLCYERIRTPWRSLTFNARHPCTSASYLYARTCIWLLAGKRLKVSIFDRQVRDSFFGIAGSIGTALSIFLIFIDIPEDFKLYSFIGFAAVLIIIYLMIWRRANTLKEVSIKIDGTTVTVKSGDIFNEEGLKAIAFNEYFDTVVDNVLISERSLNGIFLTSKLNETIQELDAEIERYPFEDGEILQREVPRSAGKSVKFRLGTIFAKDDFLLTAMSKFDSSNRANLTMPEYLEFLINFWDRVNKVYAQRSVVTPIFGSGVTRIRGHRNISDEDMLKIMLWTFRISEMRFKYPAKLTIVIHESKIDQVNLLDLKSLRNGV